MAISLVQEKSGTNTGAVTTVTVTLTSGTTAGNCLVVCWTAIGLTTQPTGVSATIGGSADNFTSAVSSANFGAGILVDPNCAGGQTSVVVTFTGGSGNFVIGAYAYEVSGLASTSVVDKTNSNQTGTTSWTTGATGTLTNANEFIVGLASCYQTTTQTITGPSSPWTNETAIHPASGANFLNTISGFQIVSATTTQTYSGTVGSSGGNTCVIASLLPASGTSVSGVAATATATAAAGSVTAGAAVSGVVATATASAAAGAVTAGATVAGAVAVAAAAATAGAAGVVTSVAGITATATAAAPAGSVTAGATVTGATATATAGATPGTAVGSSPSVVQWNTGGDMPDYGMSSTPISTTAGNGIVVYAGWDLHASPTTGVVPALYVSDSAGNFWYHLGTSDAGGYGSRCSIWCCPNARAVEWVSASLTAFASSLAYLVVEIANFPDFAVQDVEADGFVNAAIPSLQALTRTGTHTWLAQPGVTSVSVQATAGGGGGQGAKGPSTGGSGGGGGEYAAEPALAVTPGSSYSYTVGAQGGGGSANVSAGASGGNTVFHGDSVTVTAHGGGGGHNASGGAGGTGSSNTVHHNGGAGGEQVSAFHGAGGGSSGGTAAAGQSVGTDVKTAALAVAGGGPGGSGGNSTSPFYGYPPLAGPGGGGGGGGANTKGAGGGANGLAGQILLSYSVSSPVSLSLSATTVTADVAFTMIACGAGSMTLTGAPSGWTSITGVTIGGANPDGMTIFCYWQPSVSAATALTPSYTVTPDISLSGIVTTVQSSPAAPTQPNPNFPAIKVEIAEGFQPGDPSAIPPSWTDITSYCMGKDGDAFITVTYGQQYELATPEAGEMVIGVNNLAGTFTPGNPESPFFPYIVCGMPVRVSAYWDGSWYQVGYGYVERWPQEWPDLPQWGLSKLTCTDSIAVLTSATMPSALQGAILADGPYAYFPCNEQYLTYVNGLTPESGNLESYSTAEAAGLIASNASRTNQRAGMYCDSTGTVLGNTGSSPAPMETGSALNLFGDQGTGCGTSQISGSVSYAQPASGPGMIYADPNMPDPTNADGVTVELWFVYDFPDTSGQGCTLFQAFGPSPSSYWPTNLDTPTSAGPVSFSARLNSGGNVIQLQFGSTQVSAGSFTPSANPQQLVLAFPPTGSTGLLVYLNGALLDTVSLSGKPVTPWVAAVLGPATYAYSASSLVQNYVAGHLVLYPYTLAAARVATHYSTGAQGASGLDVSQGAGNILSWGYLGIPRGGPVNFGTGADLVTDGVEMGAFYNVGGSSAADALNAAILSDGGMMYAAPSGVLTLMPRWALFDQAPLATFGDATDGSQVPFLQGQAFDYDNTYLYDVVSVQRSNGPTESITAIAQDTASQMAYFTRSALRQQISTTSDLDAYTLSQWELGQYEQPQIRVRNLTVDAASNPDAAFPAILPATVSNVANVSRSPVGGVPITGSFLIQRVSHTIGPSMWTVAYQISPYAAQGAVLALDTAGFNVIGLNTLA